MKKVLMVLMRTHGDLVIATTVIRSFKNKYPNCLIDFFTEKPYVNTLEDNPDINKIIVGSSYFEANSIFKNGNYDKIFRLNMVNNYESCWHHISEWQNQHLMQWYHGKLGIGPLTDTNHYIYLSDKDNKIVEKIVSDLPKGKRVVVHTSSGSHAGEGSRVESKDWPIENFNALANSLINLGCHVIQIGAFNDKKLSNPKIIDLTGKLTFKQNLGLFKECSAYIGNDSGPAYLSSTSGIPTIIIMGATQNKGLNSGPSVGPLGDNVFYIEPNRPDDQNCSPVPCFNHCIIKHNNGRGCVADISIKTVSDKVFEILGINIGDLGNRKFKADVEQKKDYQILIDNFNK